MTAFPRILAAVLAAASAAAPAAAQYPYPYPYPQQPYPPAYPYGYPGQPYPGTGTILDQLLRPYGVNERTAIRQCADAAVAQARNEYRGYGYNQNYGGYPPGYPYGQGIAAPAMRVTAITSVERRSNGLRVRGLLDSGFYGYNQRYPGYNQGYATGDLTFRCTVDWRGYVSDVRIRRNDNWRRY